MSEILTMEEIEQKFDGEWVLIEDVETDDKLEVIRGKVIFHDKDKDRFNMRVMQSRNDHLVAFYIGKSKPKMEFLLNY